MSFIIQYTKNVFIALDQTVNAIIGGDPDETISSTIGKLKEGNGGSIPKHKRFVRVIDFLLDKIDPGHSIKSIERDEGKNELRPWVKRRNKKGKKKCQTETDHQ